MLSRYLKSKYSGEVESRMPLQTARTGSERGVRAIPQGTTGPYSTFVLYSLYVHESVILKTNRKAEKARWNLIALQIPSGMRNIDCPTIQPWISEYNGTWNMPEDAPAYLEKRYAGTHQDFWIWYTITDHRALGLWAADCAEHLLPYFEEKYPQDPRPRDALRTLRAWVQTGEFRMAVIRGTSLAAHAAAKAVKKEERAAGFAAMLQVKPWAPHMFPPMRSVQFFTL